MSIPLSQIPEKKFSQKSTFTNLCFQKNTQLVSSLGLCSLAVWINYNESDSRGVMSRRWTGVSSHSGYWWPVSVQASDASSSSSAVIRPDTAIYFSRTTSLVCWDCIGRRVPIGRTGLLLFIDESKPAISLSRRLVRVQYIMKWILIGKLRECLNDERICVVIIQKIKNERFDKPSSNNAVGCYGTTEPCLVSS